jgi:hypothetical protein
MFSACVVASSFIEFAAAMVPHVPGPDPGARGILQNFYLAKSCPEQGFQCIL